MSTFAQQIDPNDPRLTEAPLRIPFEHPTPSTPEQLYFISIGLNAVAQRLADVDLSWDHYKVDESDMWKKHKFSSMLRSEPGHAWVLSKQHELQYAPFGGYIESFGTQLNFRFLANPTVLHSEEYYRLRKLVQTIRAVVYHFLPKSISKIGCVEDSRKRYNRSVKVLHGMPVDAALLARIQSFLPPEVSVTRSIFPKSEFESELHKWAHMDLSSDWKDRAQFELLLHHFHQVESHHFQMGERSQFALNPTAKKSLYANSPVSFQDLLNATIAPRDGKRQVYVPRSPKTGRLAKFKSITTDKATRSEDLLPCEWSQLSPLA